MYHFCPRAALRLHGSPAYISETVSLASEIFQIETIIFDVGNVLVNYDWKSYLDSFPYTSQVKEQIGKAVFESEIWNEQDRGVLDPGEYIRQFVRNAPQLEEEILQVLSNNEKTISVFDYAKTWTHYLKNQGYRLYILSNYPQRLLEKTQGDMDFLEYMDGVIFSCQVQQVKPEPQIYQTLLETFSIEPSKAVFLDDRKENLDAAAKFGIHTIQFHNLKQATADLKTGCGVIHTQNCIKIKVQNLSEGAGNYETDIK